MSTPDFAKPWNMTPIILVVYPLIRVSGTAPPMPGIGEGYLVVHFTSGKWLITLVVEIAMHTAEIYFLVVHFR